MTSKYADPFAPNSGATERSGGGDPTFWKPEIVGERFVGRLDRVEASATYKDKDNAVFSTAAILTPAAGGELVATRCDKDLKVGISANLKGTIEPFDSGKYFALEYTGEGSNRNGKFRMFKVAEISEEMGRDIVMAAAVEVGAQ